MSARFIPRRAFLAGAGASLIVAPAAFAQQQRRVPRIAYLSPYPTDGYDVRGFWEGLSEFGHIEGRNIVIEYFLGLTSPDQSEWAAKAVASKPDLIVAGGPSAFAVKGLTTTIPIVFISMTDPVATGLVTSLSRPGGNLTGPTGMVVEGAAKRLQMLTEFVPAIARVAALYSFASSNAQFSRDEILRAGKILNVDVHLQGVSVVAELAPAIASAAAAGAQALLVVGTTLFADNARVIADEALMRRLPSISDNRAHAESGGLLSYGANVQGVNRRAAYYVDRILKGAKPADLPVEQPMLFDLVINKKTADALGLEIPLGLWVQATEILE